MNIRETVILFLQKFIDVCGIQKTDNYDDCTSINDYIQYVNDKSDVDIQHILPFINCFHESKIGNIDLIQNIDELSSRIHIATIVDFTIDPDFSKRYRKFSFSSEQGSYNPIEFLYKPEYFNKESSSIINFTSDDLPSSKPNASFIGILHFIIKHSTCQEELERLARLIKDKAQNHSVIISLASNTTLISLYSYLYYSFLLKGLHTELDHDHIFPIVNNRFDGLCIPALQYDFSQFIELADVINEANMSPDILTRYLKLYHQLEYLAYRVYLKEIAKNAKEERSFITDLHKLSGSDKKNEEGSFKKSFQKIFKNRNEDMKIEFFNIQQPTLADFESFAKDRFEIEFDTNDSAEIFLGKLSRFIYKVRNSIVHNKESEFHLTITKVDLYPVLKFIIPWLINTLEKEIDTLLRSFDDNIKYDEREIQLY